MIAFLAATSCSSLFAGPGSSLPLLPNKIVCFLSFLALEAALGMYFPSAGSLRSRVIPESHRATVTNLYRVPMNLLTCTSLIAVNHPAVAADKRIHFAACSLALLLGCVGAIFFRNLDQRSDYSKEVKEK